MFDGMTDEQVKMIAELSDLRVLKIEKDTLMMSEQQLLWSDEISREINAYWVELNTYWKNKKIPSCTCADHEGGFLAKEQYNPFYYNGSPCSLEYYNNWKAENDPQQTAPTH